MGKARVEAEVEVLDDASKKLLEISDRFSKLGDTIGALGRRTAIAGAAITGAIALAGNQFAKFERGLAQVNTVLDKGTEQYLPVFKEAISDMAVKYGQSAEQMLVATREMIGGIVPAQEAMRMLDISARLAAAGVTDINTASTVLADTIAAFNIPFSRAERVADALFVTTKEGKASIESLGAAMGKTGVLVSGAGVKFEDFMATVIALTRHGVPAETAMAAIRGVIVAASRTTEDGEKVLAKYGLRLDTTSIASQGLLKSMAALAPLSEDELAMLAGDARARIAVIAAIQEQGRAQEFLSSIMSSAGKMNENYQKTTGTIGFATDRLKESVKKLQRDAFEPLAPTVTRAVEGLIRLGEGMDRLGPGFKSVAIHVAAVTGVVLVLVGAVGIFSGSILKTIALVQKLTVVKALLTAAIGGVTSAFALLAAGIAGLAFGGLIVRLTQGKKAFEEYADAIKHPTKLLEGFNAVLLGSQAAAAQYQKVWAKVDPWQHATRAMAECKREIAAASEELGKWIEFSRKQGFVSRDTTTKIDELRNKIYGLRKDYQTQEEWLKQHPLEARIEWLGEERFREKYAQLDLGEKMRESLQSYEAEMTAAEAAQVRLGESAIITAQRISESWRYVGERVEDVFQRDMRQGFSGFYEAILSGTASLSDAWKQFTWSLKQSFIKAFADILADQTVRMVFGGLSMRGGAPEGVGGIMGIGGVIGGLVSIFTGQKQPIVGVPVQAPLTAKIETRQLGGYITKKEVVGPGEFVFSREVTARHRKVLERMQRGLSAGELGGQPPLNIYNIVDPNFVNAAIVRDPSAVINKIGADVMESGVTRRVFGRYL